MKDSFDLKPTREKYEPPEAVRLRDAAAGVGANCESGSLAAGHCENGGSANAGPGCTDGSDARQQCATGTGFSW